MSKSKKTLLTLSLFLIFSLFFIEAIVCIYLMFIGAPALGILAPVLFIYGMFAFWPITLVTIAANILFIFAFVKIKKQLNMYEDSKKTVKDLISFLLAVLAFWALAYYLAPKQKESENPYSAEFKGFNIPSQL